MNHGNFANEKYFVWKLVQLLLIALLTNLEIVDMPATRAMLVFILQDLC